MTTLYLILYLLAAVFFALSAFNATVLSRVNLVSLGLFCWVLVPLIQAVQLQL